MSTTTVSPGPSLLFDNSQAKLINTSIDSCYDDFKTEKKLDIKKIKKSPKSLIHTNDKKHDLSYDVNDSNLSLKPLKTLTSATTSTPPAKIIGGSAVAAKDGNAPVIKNSQNWMESYRRPIIGPNG